jgi:hypothetical protein
MIPAARHRSLGQCLRRSAAATLPDRIGALELLASCREGCTEAIMLARGFTVEQMVELVRAGLAVPERIVAGARTIEVTRVRIADAGRRTVTPGTQ